MHTSSWQRGFAGLRQLACCRVSEFPKRQSVSADGWSCVQPFWWLKQRNWLWRLAGACQRVVGLQSPGTRPNGVSSSLKWRAVDSVRSCPLALGSWRAGAESLASIITLVHASLGSYACMILRQLIFYMPCRMLFRVARSSYVI